MIERHCLPERFETENYRLRRVRVADAAAILAAYAADPAVTRYLAWKPHEDVAETAAFLEAASDAWERGESFRLAAFHRERPGDLLGMFGARVHGSRVNYGYVLKASVWGRGCASEIMRRLVAHALSHPAIFRAEAFCDIENAASARVLEKAGMVREGVLRRYLDAPNLSDLPRDCVVHAKVRQGRCAPMPWA
ncbi:GNAT family N-acetyltransferase [Paracoccus binzhouensis]|uniref:GNAT family N-acetyltransferase n=1 Tax=Paracoccus binzhouensis TaxID=2796149 RepID=UPI0018EF0769|nr:GNAT family protein [Paracoccus binzhouensis]